MQEVEQKQEYYYRPSKLFLVPHGLSNGSYIMIAISQYHTLGDYCHCNTVISIQTETKFLTRSVYNNWQYYWLFHAGGTIITINIFLITHPQTSKITILVSTWYDIQCRCWYLCTTRRRSSTQQQPHHHHWTQHHSNLPWSIWVIKSKRGQLDWSTGKRHHPLSIRPFLCQKR